MLGCGGIINVLLLLALCGGNYFVMCNRCCTAVSETASNIQCMRNWTVCARENFGLCVIEIQFSLIIFEHLDDVTFIFCDAVRCGNIASTF